MTAAQARLPAVVSGRPFTGGRCSYGCSRPSDVNARIQRRTQAGPGGPANFILNVRRLSAQPSRVRFAGLRPPLTAAVVLVRPARRTLVIGVPMDGAEMARNDAIQRS
jgi:hypothetical protein